MTSPSGANLATPPAGLRNGHVQTMASSTLRKALVRRQAQALSRRAQREVITTETGARLEVWHDPPESSTPRGTVMLIHGWLGSATSGYVLSAAMHLRQAGFATVRINLRDHGDTAGLNEAPFNSARLDEAVDTVRQLRERSSEAGLMGFSLGGNFALRIARELALPTLAICPAMDPGLTMQRIDAGLPVYRTYFVNKWLRAMKAKSAAFPGRFDFSEALKLRSVSTITDLFVDQFSEFASTEDYFSRYDLTGDALANTRACILAASDDPVIPPAQFSGLPEGIEVHMSDHGGHCGFISNWRFASAADEFAGEYFSRTLAG